MIEGRDRDLHSRIEVSASEILYCDNLYHATQYSVRLSIHAVFFTIEESNGIANGILLGFCPPCCPPCGAFLDLTTAPLGPAFPHHASHI